MPKPNVQNGLAIIQASAFLMAHKFGGLHLSKKPSLPALLPNTSNSPLSNSMI